LDRVLAVHLKAAAALAEAQVAALFVPARDGSLELRAGESLDQAGIDCARIAWAGHQAELRRGITQRMGVSVVWPILLGTELVAVVYLDQVHAGFPEQHQESHARVLAERVRTLAMPKALGPYIAALADRRSDVRRQLEVALRQVAGNVSAAARVLGVNRDTIYERAARFSIDLAAFRPLRRGGQ
jgi:hypothetical protein